jgi:XTP/dITP diphosphohydrolase
MKTNTLFFVTSNEYKFAEFERIFSALNVKLEHLNYEIPEIQTIDMEKITRDKILKAYSLIYQPVMVDHSSIGMKALMDLPQGLNKIFWDKLNNGICEIASKLGNTNAEIFSYIGICDGETIHIVFHMEEGNIASSPSDMGKFHLDRIFIPKGCDKVLSDMSEKERDKNGYREKAALKVIDFLKTIDLGKKLGLK